MGLGLTLPTCIENSSSSLSLPASFPFKQICIFTRLPRRFSQENTVVLLRCCAQVPNENVCKWVTVKRSGSRSKRVLWGSLPCINKGLLPFWLARGMMVDRVQSSVAWTAWEGTVENSLLACFWWMHSISTTPQTLQAASSNCWLWWIVQIEVFERLIVYLYLFWRLCHSLINKNWILGDSFFAAVGGSPRFTLTLSARRSPLPGWAGQRGVAALFAFQPPFGAVPHQRLLHISWQSSFTASPPNPLCLPLVLVSRCQPPKRYYLLTSAAVLADWSFALQMCLLLCFWVCQGHG